MTVGGSEGLLYEGIWKNDGGIESMTRHEDIIMDVYLCTRFNERAELVQRMRVKR